MSQETLNNEVTFSLKMKNATKDVEGKFKVVAKNEHGVADCEAPVTVESKDESFN